MALRKARIKIMSDMYSVDPLSHKDLEIYKKDFDRGSQILNEAAQEYTVTTESHKKKQLQFVMSEALTAMNEIISDVLRTDGEKYEKKLNTDYNNFIKNSSPENLEKINSDLKNIKNHMPG